VQLLQMTDLGGSCGSEPAAWGNVCTSLACRSSNSEYLVARQQVQKQKQNKDREHHLLRIFMGPPWTHWLAGCISHVHGWTGSAGDWPHDHGSAG
jgi:hypothetical protein